LPALGGGANSVVSLAAGGLSGVVAMSALIATGVVAVGPAPAGPQALALVGCPGSGSVIALAQPGDQMLVTGRSADGAWFRVYVPGPAGHDGWVPAATVNLLADGSTLPVAGCGEVAAATGTPAPTAVSATLTPASPTPTAPTTARPTTAPTTAPTPSPTATDAQHTTAPTATPVPTPTPNLGPVFAAQPSTDASSVATNPLGSGNCNGVAQVVTVATQAKDPDGVAKIELWMRKPGASSYEDSGPFGADDPWWYANINPAASGVLAGGTLSYYAVAFDTKGAKTKSAAKSIKVVRCDTEASISGGIELDIVNGSYETNTCGDLSIPWSFKLTDADGLTGATVEYWVQNQSGAGFGGTISLQYILFIKDWYGTSATVNGGPYTGTNTVTWLLRTTDQFGGHSTRNVLDSLTGVCIK
jgi:hypothetical protein